MYLYLLTLDAPKDDLLLNSKVLVDEEILNADKSALTIDKNFPCLKIQFLFTFLNVYQLYVYDEGRLAGVITKEGFVKKSALIE